MPWPSCGFTQRDLVAYYLAVAPALLPHLSGRAVTLARFPDGVDGPGWFQSNCPPGRIPTADVVGTRGLHVWVPVDGGDRTFAETSAFALGPAEVLARVASRGDLFAPALRPPPTARSDAP